MATTTGGAGEWRWRPDPALIAALQRLAAQHRAAIQLFLDASLAPQRQRWAELARQISSFNEATRTASEAARAISSIQPQLQV